ncbi:hypothetical protein J7T55_004195 [Diaporthe amygdali]|uniref:uncharacterized protein n=1 Tax=Phomopsis amygdali TaxID=1214568 RepID=UPI0022FE9A6A|nr:uncharacterized protein J7T55_004195 [Diaporthe amygdali]KAJ0100699.1 hypothetical protein J7T55_004195 [Diaporthe amygdali]
MAVGNKTERSEKKKLRRNRDYGLLPKCYKYGRLNGVELFLGIRYTEKNELYTYSSRKHLPWLNNIYGAPNATNLLPQDVGEKQTRGKKDLTDDRSKESTKDTDDQKLSFPDLPMFNLSVLTEKSQPHLVLQCKLIGSYGLRRILLIALSTSSVLNTETLIFAISREQNTSIEVKSQVAPGYFNHVYVIQTDTGKLWASYGVFVY